MLQTTGLNRTDLDKYYTIPSVAKKCVELVKSTLNIAPNDIVIEPSAGAGAFIPYIKSLGARTNLFFDIAPENKSITKQNYLTMDVTKYIKEKPSRKIHVIGNPPFGRQSTLAKQFIAKSVQFADTVSFILPLSFKKTSLQKTFPDNWHLKKQVALQSNAYTVNDQRLDVPSVFQIWVKDDSKKRRAKKTLAPTRFQFVSKNEKPDFAVRRIGFYAGNVYTKNIRKLSSESHYFVKADAETNPKDIYNAFSGLQFKHNNTVGPRSVSKQELLQKLPPHLVSNQTR